MHNLNIQGTASTPEVNYDEETNVLEIKGESYPENTKEFYKPVFEWLDDYLNNNNEKITINLNITYLNTSSLKAMMTFFDILENAYQEGKQMEVNWFYNPENEVALEIGREFDEDIEFPFNLVSVE